MAILSCYEKWEAMTVGETATDGYKGHRRFQLISDIHDESPAVVLAHSTLPQLGEPFPGSLVTYLTERTPSRTEASRTEWFVDLDYKSILSQDERDRVSDKNPLDRKATIEWVSQKVTRAVRRVKKSDYYKNYSAAIEGTFAMRAAANSATDPFEPVYEVQMTDWIALIRKNVDAIPPWFLTYEDAVNSDAFALNFYGTTLTIPKGCAKVGMIGMPKAKQENGQEYIQLSYQVATRQKRELAPGESEAPEPWDDEILDTGMRYRTYKSAGKHQWKNEETEDGISVQLPVPFDGSGRAVDASGDAVPEDKLWWCLLAPFKRKPFTGVLPIT